MSQVLIAQLSNLRAPVDALSNQPTRITNQLISQHNAALSHIKSSIDTLETQAKREMTELKREKAQERVKLFIEEYNALKLQLASLSSINQRQELLERPQTIHQRHQQPEQQSTILMMDQMERESGVLDNSHSRVDEFIQIGKNALNELHDQRSILKRRMLDVANGLGMGGTVIRLIEQRTTQDKYVLYGGMLFTIIGIALIIYYFK